MKTLLVLLLLLTTACDKKPAPTPSTDAAAPPPAVADAGPTTTASAAPAETPKKPTRVERTLRRVDADIVFHKRQAEKLKGWLHYEALAGSYLGRARLTGNIDDYVAAGKAFDEAFTVAKDDAGPYFGRAHYNFSIHRIEEVEPDLKRDEKRSPRTDSDIERVAALRGDVALDMADLAKARKYYQKALKTKRTAATVARVAFLDLKTGDYDAARKGYEEVVEMSKSDKPLQGWALLQRGLVEREVNDPAEALKWFDKANEVFSGWYQIEAHIAEAKRQTGDVDGAIDLYQSIIARTPHGEFMAALAGCYADKGDTARQQEWVEKARAAFERDLAKLPGVVTGQAIAFYVGDNPEKALELAQKNVELRPSHEARKDLAQVYLALHEPEKARAALKPVASSAWASPDFLATVAIAFEGANDKIARRAYEKVDKVDPKAIGELRKHLGLDPS